MLAWAGRQTDSRGLLQRQKDGTYFFNIGFLDWARTPVGGRFEELPGSSASTSKRSRTPP